MTDHQIAVHEITPGIRLHVYREPSGVTRAQLHSQEATAEAPSTLTGSDELANATMMTWAANTLSFAMSCAKRADLMQATMRASHQAMKLGEVAGLWERAKAQEADVYFEKLREAYAQDPEPITQEQRDWMNAPMGPPDE